MNTTSRRFAFMTSGPGFVLELPDDFGPTPKLSSPLNIHGAWGGRSFDFIPTGMDGGMVDDPIIDVRSDRDGRTVEIHEQADDPVEVWWLRWPLEGGFLYTHLRAEEDGLDYADTILSSLSILEDSTGAVFLLLDPPLRVAAAPQPGYAEAASFVSTTQTPWGVTLQRPGFLAAGSAIVAQRLDPPVVRGGGVSGVEVVVTAADVPTARGVLELAIGSLEEM